MEDTVQINNRGRYTKVPRKWLCGRLLKDSIPQYKRDTKKYPLMFTSELDLFISKLQDATLIQIYQTGVVRLFFECDHFEESETIYLRDLPKETVEMLKSI